MFIPRSLRCRIVDTVCSSASTSMSSTSTVNTTIPDDHPIFHSHPFYSPQASSLVPGLSDPLLAVILPFLAYWFTSALFHLFDISNWAWLDRYRIHDSVEVSTRNRATRPEVFRAVIFQQALQTALGYFWLSDAPEHVDHPAAMRTVARALSSSFGVLFFSPSDERAYPLLRDASPRLAYLLYWYLIPAAQLLLAMYVFPPGYPYPSLTSLVFFLPGSSSTPGSTSSIARCTLTSSSTSTSTRCTTGSTCHMPLLRSTTTPSRASCSTRWVPCSPRPSRNSPSDRPPFSSPSRHARPSTTTAGTAFRSTRSRCSAETQPTTMTSTTRSSASSLISHSPGSSIGTSSSARA